MTWIAVVFTESAMEIPEPMPSSCTDRRVRTAVSVTPASTRASATGPFSATETTFRPACSGRWCAARP